MGFLQNHAIKKSCRGLAKELLDYVENYIFQLPEETHFDNFEERILPALEDFVDNFHSFPNISLDLKSIKYSDWPELYFAILLRSVKADLSYDPSIGTDDHNKLIIEIGRQVLDSWSKARMREFGFLD